MPKAFFQKFKTNIAGNSLPEKFTFPFYYEPHPLALIAAQELQDYLETQTDFEHNFGLEKDQEGYVIGKMFGVLVCQNDKQELGYLWAFSGKLAEVNHLDYFVPTVFDMLDERGFFKKEEKRINALNQDIEFLEAEPAFQVAKQTLEQILQEAEADINREKRHQKEQKKHRDFQRKQLVQEPDEKKLSDVLESLKEESQQEGILLKKMMAYWNYKKSDAQKEVAVFEEKINVLKELRKNASAALQQKLFAEYAFLNQYNESKSLGELFDNNPPAGAGECAAPKLLHYAFKNKLKPVCLAEFWWGQSPKSEVRKHKQFYPACKQKCEPILMQHMLDGIDMDENIFLLNPAEGKEVTVVFEDDSIAVINKPAEFLSVPGKVISDSVYQRMKNRYPDATGPLIVHRLDMSTSGIMLIAKTEEAYLNLQQQFIKRTIKKCYEALLDRVVAEPSGYIDLPLRVDLEDRPRQLICYTYGKKAQTRWEVVEIKDAKTRIHFYPITGRTHQLRVHASHVLGLNAPIVGDDLYGKKADRLHLHAKTITFVHPVSKQEMTFTVAADF